MAHAGHGFTHTSVELHDDGTATMEHHHESGDEKKNKRYAVQDLDGIHDGLENHLRMAHDKEDALEEKVHPGIHKEVAEKAEGDE